MRIVRSVAAMQRLARRWKSENVRVGFVPTMGYLHEGHLSLVRRAREIVGGKGKVVLSIYVNPTQFGPKEDLSRYPRNFTRDAKLCRDEGVDAVFAPTDREMYPPGEPKFSTCVVEETLSRTIEGKSRPTHFCGVTTVVAKLFNIVQPGAAVFGAKDFQQAAIIKRMVRDLNFPVKIVVAPTVREADGVAMSSRNKHLVGGLRGQATVLCRSVAKVRLALAVANKPVSAMRLKTLVRAVIKTSPAARLDYVEFFNPETFLPLNKVGHGAQMALAVFIGKTRLIDNAAL